VPTVICSHRVHILPIVVIVIAAIIIIIIIIIDKNYAQVYSPTYENISDVQHAISR
jgi:hypothetical protein